jgi:hypothetical protein
LKGNEMAMYRITRFAASDMEKAGKIAESMRSTLENAGADFIDLVSYGNGKGVVIAKYPSQETMDAATEIAKSAFAKMIEDGAVEGDSVHPHTGEVFKSF